MPQMDHYETRQTEDNTMYSNWQIESRNGTVWSLITGLLFLQKKSFENERKYKQEQQWNKMKFWLPKEERYPGPQFKYESTVNMKNSSPNYGVWNTKRI